MSETKPGTSKKPKAGLEASFASLSGLGRSSLGASGLRPSGSSFWAGTASRWAALAVVVLAILATVAPTFLEGTIHYVLNERAERDIHAPFTMETTDPVALRKARDAVVGPAIFWINRNANARVEDFLALMDEARRLEEDAALNGSKKRAALEEWCARRFSKTLSEGALLLAMRQARSQDFRDAVSAMLRHMVNERGIVYFSILGGLKQAARDGRAVLLAGENQPLKDGAKIPIDRASLFVESDKAEQFALGQMRAHARYADLGADFQNLIELFVNVNVERNAKREEGELARLRQQVAAQSRLWPKGRVVVSAGEIVGEEQADVLAAFNARARAANWTRLFFFTGLIAAMIFFLATYAAKFQPESFRDVRSILATCFPVVAALLIGRLLLMLFGTESGAGFAFPSALVGMLGVIMVEARFAFLLVVCSSLLFGVAAGIASEQNFGYLIVSIASGFTAVSSLYALQKRLDVLGAGAKAGFVGAVSVAGVGTLSGGFGAADIFAGFAGGFISSLLTNPCLYLLERFGGATTDVGLMELTTVRHPLLEELEEKAPGTFQHTINVAKLGEAAAVAIGANYLLVRAGCYFHDIGKMDKPKYFSENQVSPEDRRAHDDLKPSMSALIIKEHVKKGVKKAEEHGLPPRVIDFIREHHGTTSIAYFYQKALKIYEESDSNDPVNQEDFRYAGPAPRSRETAIALLADTVDAVATAKLNAATVTRDEIRQLVRKVINDKFREEQFDQCDLTLRDLSLIQDAFVRTLEARFHHRVKYPEPPPKKRAAATTQELKTKGQQIASVSERAERRDAGSSTPGSGFSVRRSTPGAGSGSGVYRAVGSADDSLAGSAAEKRRQRDSQAIEPDDEENGSSGESAAKKARGGKS